jgi:tetratricopeptide (TPR) repeat protein
MALSTEKVMEQVSSFLRESRHEECAEFLKTLRDEALREGRTEDAAHLSSFLGSTFLAAGREDDALAAYESAEENDPSAWATLRTARYLWQLGRADQATEKVKGVLTSIRPDSQEYLEAQALSGCVTLARGDIEASVQAFATVAGSDLLARMPVVGWDFVLVDQLVRRGLELVRAREYLERGLAKARQERDASTEEMVLAIMEKLEARPE